MAIKIQNGDMLEGRVILSNMSLTAAELFLKKDLQEVRAKINNPMVLRAWGDVWKEKAAGNEKLISLVDKIVRSYQN